jgi:hypothetical protein
MAREIHTYGVHSPVQPPSLVLPNKCIASGPVNENYVSPAWGDAVHSGEEMNESAIDFHSWHV